MKASFDNIMLQSFQLWLDNRICKEGEGYINVTGLLYQQKDTTRNQITYASPYSEWVYDSCVPGAVVPSGFYNNQGQFLTRASGITMDFRNGRLLSSGNLGPTVSGVYSRKEYNVYISTEETVNFYLEAVSKENINLEYIKTGALPYGFVAPCIVVTNSYGKNEPFALGGMQESNRTLRLFVINDNNFKCEALNSLITDAKDMYFSMIPDTEVPLTFYGDLKTPASGYNYCNLKDKYPCGQGVYIEEVYSYKLNEKSNRNRTFTISLFEMDVKRAHYRGQI